jgi:hypothetical protein
MQHLNLEDIARLVDEAPEPAEAAHLRDCLACRRELKEMQAQTRALAALPDVDPPAGAWRGLEAALAAESLIRPQPVRAIWYHHAGTRAAAALALFVLGGAAGAALWGGRAPAGAGPSDGPRIAADSHAAYAGEVETFVATLPEDWRLESDAPAVRAPSGVRLASGGDSPAPRIRREPAPQPSRRIVPQVSSVTAAHAVADLAEAQAAYVTALQRYAAVADVGSGADPQTRLAALDQLVLLTTDALERVPGDPVINGYLMAALSERDQLRREIRAAANVTWF